MANFQSGSRKPLSSYLVDCKQAKARPRYATLRWSSHHRTTLIYTVATQHTSCSIGHHFLPSCSAPQCRSSSSYRTASRCRRRCTAQPQGEQLGPPRPPSSPSSPSLVCKAGGAWASPPWSCLLLPRSPRHCRHSIPYSCPPLSDPTVAEVLVAGAAWRSVSSWSSLLCALPSGDGRGNGEGSPLSNSQWLRKHGGQAHPTHVVLVMLVLPCLSCLPCLRCSPYFSSCSPCSCCYCCASCLPRMPTTCSTKCLKDNLTNSEKWLYQNKLGK